DQLLAFVRLVVLVQGGHRLLKPAGLQQLSRVARVLRSDQIDAGQRRARARAEIRKVADGRCDDIENPWAALRRSHVVWVQAVNSRERSGWRSATCAIGQ